MLYLVISLVKTALYDFAIFDEKSGAVDDATTPLCFTVVQYNAPNQSPGSAGRYSAGK